jgi:hypothetical protein
VTSAELKKLLLLLCWLPGVFVKSIMGDAMVTVH